MIDLANGSAVNAAHDRYINSEQDRICAPTWDAPRAIRIVSDDEIAAVIEKVALTGAFEDEFGNWRNADPLSIAVANAWTASNGNLPEPIGTAFITWAKAVARMAKWGR